MSKISRRTVGCVLILLWCASAALADGDQAIQLFDGKTFKGWTAAGGKPVTKNWSIEDGMLALNGVGGSLFTVDEFGDFDLSFQWKIAPKGNSGVKYHVNYYPKGIYGRPAWLGCEYQIFDDSSSKPTTKFSSGALYDLYPPEAERELKPAGEFNESRIVVRGPKIEHWLNGKKIVSADMSTEDWNEKLQASKFKGAKEFMKRPKGHIELQDHRSRVWFRDIKLTPLDSNKAQSEGESAK